MPDAGADGPQQPVEDHGAAESAGGGKRRRERDEGEGEGEADEEEVGEEGGEEEEEVGDLQQRGCGGCDGEQGGERSGIGRGG